MTGPAVPAPGRAATFLSAALDRAAWMIWEEALPSVQAAATMPSFQAPENADQIMAAAPVMVPTTRPGKSVAILNLNGVIVSRAPAWAESWGYVSPQAFAAQVTALANDATVAAILVSTESPGGSVFGTQEAVDAVAYARSRKRIVFMANDMMCSGAYMIASQASEIVATPAAMVGSIGVITTNVSYKKALDLAGIVVNYIRSVVGKAQGQPYEDLTDDARQSLQDMVNTYHGAFVATVAKGRRVRREVVSKEWATGAVWIGADAVAAGLADRVGSFQAVLAELAANPNAVPPPPPEDDAAQEDDTEERGGPTAPSGSVDGAGVLPSNHRPVDAEAPQGSGTDPADQTADAPDHSQEAPMKLSPELRAKIAAGVTLTAAEQATVSAAALASFAADTAAGQPAQAQTPAPEQAAPAAPVAATPTAAPQASATEADLRAQLDAANARAEAAQARLDAATQVTEAERFSAMAVSLGQPASMGPVLQRASANMSAEDFSALQASLRAGGAARDMVVSAAPAGTNRDNVSPAAGLTPAQEYGQRVQAVMAATPGMTRAAAAQAVMADKDFARRYHAGR